MKHWKNFLKEVYIKKREVSTPELMRILKKDRKSVNQSGNLCIRMSYIIKRIQLVPGMAGPKKVSRPTNFWSINLKNEDNVIKIIKKMAEVKNEQNGMDSNNQIQSD